MRQCFQDVAINSVRHPPYFLCSLLDMNANQHSPEYLKHLKSANWRKFCKLALRAANFACQKCGYGSARLEVHHLNYDRLGREYLTDVQVLCPDCHPKADLERKLAAEARGRERQEQSAYHTYMMKTYGDGYERDEDTYEEFREWIDSKREDY